MKNFKRILFFAITLFMVMQFNAFMAPNQSTAQAATTVVCSRDTGLYKRPGVKSPKILTIKKGKKAVVYSSSGTFYYVKVTYSGKSYRGYMLKRKTRKGYTGSDVISYAKQFVGNRYVYGGTSLTYGTDCSGFTMGVYKHFGVNLPHSSYSQRYYGQRVSSLSQAKAGDLLCYNGHVALYMGGGKIIHAANPSAGICTSYYIRANSIVSIRRFF